MIKKKALTSLTSLASIVFLPWGISLLFKKNLQPWVTNWWNTSQSEAFFTDIQEKNVIERFMKLEERFLLEEMINEDPETNIQRLHIGIHKETIQLFRVQNEDHTHILLHFLTNITSLAILSAYSILGNEELVTLNSWFQEFLYNLSDTLKAFSILLLTDSCIGFHSTHVWELMIDLFYNDFGLFDNHQILSGIVSAFPVILDTILKYWIFHYLNRVSPSLVVVYGSLTE
uniref:Potassium/proton antiporter CemA n=1 Tax=Trithuria inconspicua TaxID=405043 RepID=M1X108_9MAGN|nr:cemA [Trithuria inconspicua]CCJ32529.1 cemA [Trithuria inconspicua]